MSDMCAVSRFSLDFGHGGVNSDQYKALVSTLEKYNTSVTLFLIIGALKDSPYVVESC